MQSVQIIIERLKTHPEDFFGEIADKKRLGAPYPKFQEITNCLDDLLTDKHDGHVHRLWYLTDAERIALLDAYKEALRASFEARVFHILLAPQEKEDTGTITYRPAMTLDSTGSLGIGLVNPWGNVVPKQEGGPVNV